MTRRAAAREAALPLLEAARQADRATAQARLLSASDRDLAVALWPLEAPERAELLEVVGAAKARRLSDELERMEHVRLPSETIAVVARHLAAHISGDRPLGPASRYYKPAGS